MFTIRKSRAVIIVKPWKSSQRIERFRYSTGHIRKHNCKRKYFTLHHLNSIDDDDINERKTLGIADAFIVQYQNCTFVSKLDKWLHSLHETQYNTVHSPTENDENIKWLTQDTQLVPLLGNCHWQNKW